ncbi:MAG: hypothetical protein ACM3YE_10920 [Bacteroidota bacterium]
MVKAWLEKGNLAVVLDLNCDVVNKLKKDGGNNLLTLVCDVTNSFFDSITIKMSYWFPGFTGKMLVKMTGRAQKA